MHRIKFSHIRIFASGFYRIITFCKCIQNMIKISYNPLQRSCCFAKIFCKFSDLILRLISNFNIIHVVHRRDAFRGDKIYADALAKRENVTVHWNSRVTAIHGETALEGVTVEDIPSGMQRRLPCEGLFVCVGRTPNSQLVRGLIPMDEADYLLAEDTKTPIPGVFAAGDLRKKPLRQVITAAADGAVAAHLAGEFLALEQ